MELFAAILYIHVIATLGLVAAMGAEGIALRQVIRSQGQRELIEFIDPLPGMRVTASICLAILFLTGGFLTDRIGLWRMAWPKIAVLIIIVFGALAGISSRKLKSIRRSSIQSGPPDDRVLGQSPIPFLKYSLSIRTGLVLAAVWLMTAKPDFSQSLGVVLGLLIVSWAVAALIRPPSATRQPSSVRHEFDRSAR